MSVPTVYRSNKLCFFFYSSALFTCSIDTDADEYRNDLGNFYDFKRECFIVYVFEYDVEKS